MEKLIRKVANIIVISIAGCAGLLGLYIIFNGGQFKLGEPSRVMDITFYLIYILVFIGIALILVFALMQIISSKKQIIITLVIAAVAVLVLLLCYLMAPTELSEVAERVGITENSYRWVGASLNLAYVMFIGLILTFLGMYIYTKIKNK